MPLFKRYCPASMMKRTHLAQLEFGHSVVLDGLFKVMPWKAFCVTILPYLNFGMSALIHQLASTQTSELASLVSRP